MTEQPTAQRLHETFPIVGAHFRPPAKALLSVLAQGTALRLVPEPDNPFDPNAVKVTLSSAVLRQQLADAPQVQARLEQELAFFGRELADVLAQEEHHLGYVPRGLAAELAPRLSGRSVGGELSFSATGQTQISVQSATLSQES